MTDGEMVRTIAGLQKETKELRQIVAHLPARFAGGGGGFRIVRMKVTNADAGPNTVLAKVYDGTTTSGADTAVRVYWQREVDEELYAYRPTGRTDAVHDGKPVDWIEVYTLGRPQFDGMGVTAAGGQQVWDFTRAVALPGV